MFERERKDGIVYCHFIIIYVYYSHLNVWRNIISFDRINKNARGRKSLFFYVGKMKFLCRRVVEVNSMTSALAANKSLSVNICSLCFNQPRLHDLITMCVTALSYFSFDRFSKYYSSPVGSMLFAGSSLVTA